MPFGKSFQDFTTRIISTLGVVKHCLLKLKLHCKLDFELSRNQRQGSEYFLGKLILWDDFSLSSLPMVFWMWHIPVRILQVIKSESKRLATKASNHRLHSIIDFERSRNQRQGSKFLLRKLDGFPSSSSTMSFWLWHMQDSNSQPLRYGHTSLTTTPWRHHLLLTILFSTPCEY